jgi:uncharacterized Zn finger protein
MEHARFRGRPGSRSLWSRLGGRPRARESAGVACETCGSLLTCPRDWSMAGDAHWLVDFRCGECGAWMMVLLTNAQAARLDCLVARQTASMLRAAERHAKTL